MVKENRRAIFLCKTTTNLFTLLRKIISDMKDNFYKKLSKNEIALMIGKSILSIGIRCVLGFSAQIQHQIKWRYPSNEKVH